VVRLGLHIDSQSLRLGIVTRRNALTASPPPAFSSATAAVRRRAGFSTARPCRLRITRAEGEVSPGAGLRPRPDRLDLL